MAGILVGGLFSNLLEGKRLIILDNTKEFIDYCLKSNGMIFFGPVGTGKTAILAMLAHHSTIEEKFASFPCSLP